MKINNLKNKTMVSLQLDEELIRRMEKVKALMHLPITSVFIRMAVNNYCEDKLREIKKKNAKSK